jgi:hypothetical protein
MACKHVFNGQSPFDLGTDGSDKTTEWRFLEKPYKLEEVEQELRSLLGARP